MHYDEHASQLEPPRTYQCLSRRGDERQKAGEQSGNLIRHIPQITRNQRLTFDSQKPDRSEISPIEYGVDQSFGEDGVRRLHSPPERQRQ